MSEWIQPDEKVLLQCGECLFPIAMLCLGSPVSSRETVTEAVVAAQKSSPEHLQDAALAHLIRISRTRSPEQPDSNAIPEVLLPVMKLPNGSRRVLALKLCGISTEKAAAACGNTTEEQMHRTEKALRQLTFTQGGTEPQEDLLADAVRQLHWTASDSDLFLRSVAGAFAEHAAAQSDAVVHEIVQTKQTKSKHGKTVSVPLWCAITVTCCLLCLGGVIGFLLMHQNPQPAVSSQNSADADTAHPLHTFSNDYLTMDAVQGIAAEAVHAKNPVFISTKLKEDDDSSYYIVTLQDGAKQAEIQVDAQSGEVLSTDKTDADTPLDTAEWLPVNEMRQAALDCANLSQALFLKEKRSMESGFGCYKFELLGDDGRIYSVQLEAKTGALMKYTVDDPPSADLPAYIIPEDEAVQHALKRAGDLTLDQVIVTKVKLENYAYLISYTLDDGTQYLIEMNARTGMSNVVDVNPVSADTTNAAGLIAARDTALEKAGLHHLEDVKFTKAKIDRNAGAYVYELDFETADYEYEVILNTETCEILKYYALAK